MRRQELLKRFLTGTDKTGRFIVSSKITGITYFIEPIDNGKPNKLWGDVDPATKKLTCRHYDSNTLNIISNGALQT